MSSYLTSAEAAERMDVSRATVRDLCKRGVLRGAVRGHSCTGPWRIPEASVEAWIEQNSLESGQKLVFKLGQVLGPWIARSLKPAFRTIWRALGSNHLENIVAIATLIVTVYLTLHIFDLTKRQQEAEIEMSLQVVPAGYVEEGHEWNVSINMHNSGPADVSISNLHLRVANTQAIKLVGFGYKDFASIVHEPAWPRPLPTPWPSEYGDYLVTLEDFERGDNLAVLLVFLVDSEQSLILEEKWDALGIQRVVHPDGGHSYDESQVDPDEYVELINVFIKNLSLTGQNVRITGNARYLRQSLR